MEDVMPYVETPDRTRLFYIDAGAGTPIVLVSSAWLNSRMWEHQIPALVARGFRCIYDRRGHGRSDWSWSGYDYDTLADDLACVIDHLGLRHVAFVSHSAGAGEVVRYITRYGTERVGGIALVSPTTPFPMKRADNPAGIDRSLMEADLALRTADRPKWFADNAVGFFGIGLPGVTVSPESVQHMIRECLTCSARATAEFFLTSFTSDLRDELRAVTVPALIIHGDHDVQAPIDICGRKTAELVKGSTHEVYENAAHALFFTHAQRLNADLIAFLRKLSVDEAANVGMRPSTAAGSPPAGAAPSRKESI
jgi:non-heme chloroperoxidase